MAWAPFAAAVLALLAACGSGSSSSAAASQPAVPAASAASAATAASAAPAASASSPAAAPAAGAQPPDGDATVAFGTSSLVALEDYSTGVKTPVKLTISMREGKISDLKNFKLDAQTAKGQPFYVSFEVTNAGTKPADSSGFAGRLTVANADGEEAARITLLGEFPLCDGSTPEKLAPGKTAKGCDVYILPAGQKVATVRITNNDGHITWK
jgi:hypothetical protein